MGRGEVTITGSRGFGGGYEGEVSTVGFSVIVLVGTILVTISFRVSKSLSPGYTPEPSDSESSKSAVFMTSKAPPGAVIFVKFDILDLFAL